MRKRFAKTYSLGFLGFESALLEVECQQSLQLPGFQVVGIPQNTARELTERVRSALLACGFRLPSRKFTINLAPKTLKKLFTGLDLPVALACLASEGKISREKIEQVLILGELGLDGSLKRVPLANNLAALLEKHHLKGAIVPMENSEGLQDKHLQAGGGFTHLLEVIDFLLKEGVGRKKLPSTSAFSVHSSVDFSDIKGLALPKRALLIAAAGEHHTLLLGPRGMGKSMLCSAFLGILPTPKLRVQEEIRTIYHFCGQKLPESIPVRRPHSSTTRLGLLGGGTQNEVGEMSLAHGGVLFLDEILETERATLESLRLPLETGEIHLSKAHVQICLPARFLLLAAANSCPCGLQGLVRTQCQCTPTEVRRYRKRLSHALLDRIDIRLSLGEQRGREEHFSYSSQELRGMATQARERMLQRQELPNGRLQGNRVFEVLPWNKQAKHLLLQCQEQYELSERGMVSIARLALTIADLNHSLEVGAEEVLESLHYRWQPDLGVV